MPPIASDPFDRFAQPSRLPGRPSLVAAMRKKLADVIAGDRSPMPAPPPPDQTTVTGQVDATFLSITERLHQLQYERKAIYQDLLDMDRNSPLVSTGLTIIAENTVCLEDLEIDGFRWKLEKENAEARKILDRLKRRLDLGQEAFQVVRKFVCFGEEYREIVVDRNGDVVGFNSLPAYSMMPNFDALGNRLPGFMQTPEGYGSKKIPFDEWQIVSFQYGPKRGHYFGSGLMYSARRAFRRHEKLADGMAIARLVRAYDPFLHRVPVKPEWDEKRVWEKITKYRQAITSKRGVDIDGNATLRADPFASSTDIFIPDDGSKRGGVEVLSRQNMQLMNVEDLMYHQDELLMAIRVPRKYLNMRMKGVSSTSSAILAEDRQFARMLRGTQATLRSGYYTLADRQLLLYGFYAEDLGLTVELPKINVQDYLESAKVRMTEAQAAQLFGMTILQGGMPWEIVGKQYMKLDDADLATFGKFVTDKQAELKANADAMAKAAAAGRTGQPPKSPDAPAAQEVAQVLARLGMLAQNEAERLGMRFDMGYTERYFQALDALSQFDTNDDPEEDLLRREIVTKDLQIARLESRCAALSNGR